MTEQGLSGVLNSRYKQEPKLDLHQLLKRRIMIKSLLPEQSGGEGQSATITMRMDFDR